MIIIYVLVCMYLWECIRSVYVCVYWICYKCDYIYIHYIYIYIYNAYITIYLYPPTTTPQHHLSNLCLRPIKTHPNPSVCLTYIVNFIQWCIEYGIKECTVYAFSTENWKRDASEVSILCVLCVCVMCISGCL